MAQNENLVMIHGLLGSLSFFKPETYLSGINVYLPDMYCYGDSKCLEHLSLNNQVEYLEDLILKKINKPVWLLGHSVGGAIATLFASKHPEIVKGIINVEGNFSLNDAFWCQKIASMDTQEWEEEYEKIVSHPQQWLKDSNIIVTPQREAWAIEILHFQSALSAQKVAKAVVSETGTDAYKNTLNEIISNQTLVHLFAGELSNDGWDVPQSYTENAASYTVLENTGHMMMLEKPEEFCNVIQTIINPT